LLAGAASDDGADDGVRLGRLSNEFTLAKGIQGILSSADCCQASDPLSCIVRTPLVLTFGLLVACGPKVPAGQYDACLERSEDRARRQPWIARVIDDVEPVSAWSPERQCATYEELGAACPPQENFDRLKRFWFPVLDALDEPHLADGTEQIVFRLIGYDQSHVFAIRAARRGAKVWLVVKGAERGGMDQQPPVQNIRRRVRQLSLEEWSQLESSVRASAFWDLPPLAPVPPGPPPAPLSQFTHLYGNVLTSIEAVTPGGHHFVFQFDDPSLRQARDVFYALAGCEPLTR